MAKTDSLCGHLAAAGKTQGVNQRHQHQHGQQNTARFTHLEQAHVKSQHLT